MKTIQIELNDKLAEQLAEVLRQGWFRDEGEAVRFAIIEFLETRKPALIEHFQREDIDWALKQRKAAQ